MVLPLRTLSGMRKPARVSCKRAIKKRLIGRDLARVVVFQCKPPVFRDSGKSQNWFFNIEQ